MDRWELVTSAVQGKIIFNGRPTRLGALERCLFFSVSTVGAVIHVLIDPLMNFLLWFIRIWLFCPGIICKCPRMQISRWFRLFPA